MVSLASLLLVTALVAGASWFWQRRQPGAALTASQDNSGGAIPTHLRRADFVGADSPWLIVAFSSASCLACAEVWRQIQGFESGGVSIADVEYGAEPKLHSSYGIDSVPTTVVVGAGGAVQAGFVGPLSPSAIDQIAALVS